ncbi:hypothetical protein STIP37_43 [Synechococcus T7-like phage S-TIP37]|uniref:DUF7936 domain-containing protein n=1 Tax=Synechococcus T7-like phage S-TIP37 TaxID=1332145 RepID=A0A345AYC3_9CAUD|nr:hypothetical protein HOT80_gp44 [Synechococcus T7-like phage S-TIP37]AXF42103.1 hypothetical protein STIP37_43 [Synechococcus T7-like phage S-TIP37]
MAITNTWTIDLANREVSTGKIIQATAKCTAVDSEESAVSGEAFIDVELDGDVTIAYADVTEADLVGWVKAALGTDEVARVESQAGESLKENSSSTAYGLPWVTD